MNIKSLRLVVGALVVAGVVPVYIRAFEVDVKGAKPGETITVIVGGAKAAEPQPGFSVTRALRGAVKGALQGALYGVVREIAIQGVHEQPVNGKQLVAAAVTYPMGMVPVAAVIYLEKGLLGKPVFSGIFRNTLTLFGQHVAADACRFTRSAGPLHDRFSSREYAGQVTADVVTAGLKWVYGQPVTGPNTFAYGAINFAVSLAFVGAARFTFGD